MSHRDFFPYFVSFYAIFKQAASFVVNDTFLNVKRCNVPQALGSAQQAKERMEQIAQHVRFADAQECAMLGSHAFKKRGPYRNKRIGFQDTESVRGSPGIRRRGKSRLLKLRIRHQRDSGHRYRKRPPSVWNPK